MPDQPHISTGLGYSVTKVERWVVAPLPGHTIGTCGRMRVLSMPSSTFSVAAVRKLPDVDSHRP